LLRISQNAVAAGALRFPNPLWDEREGKRRALEREREGRETKEEVWRKFERFQGGKDGELIV